MKYIIYDMIIYKIIYSIVCAYVSSFLQKTCRTMFRSALAWYHKFCENAAIIWYFVMLQNGVFK